MRHGNGTVFRRYPTLSLLEERCLIAKAKRGSRKCANEIILRHLEFIVFRLHKRGWPDLVRRYGEDLLSESIPLLYRQLKTYDLNYRDGRGRPKPVKFVSYIWKRVDGFIIDSLRKENQREKQEIFTHSLPV
jgi:DNA-directed RNA polymerase specialized sigma subunit